MEVRKEKGELIHRVSSLKGQSGAPIIKVGQNKELSIIGIHKGRIKDCCANSGRLLTPELLEILSIAAKFMGAEPFKTKE